MTKIGKRLAMVFTLAAAVPAWALVSVQSSMDRERVGVGEPFAYTVTVISDTDVEVPAPRPPDLSGFQLLNVSQASAVSQRLAPGAHGMEFQTQRMKEFSYTLQATQAGRLTIGAFDVIVDGKSYATQPVVVNVATTPQGRGGGPGSANSAQQQDEMDAIDRQEDELFNMLLQRRGGAFGGGAAVPPRAPPAHRTLPVNPNEAFFIQVEVDKTEVYEGEQVTASWYVYTRGQMETLDRVKFPSLRGFWKEIIEEVPTIQFTEEIVNGVPYRKALLASHALFPLKPGTAVIDEYKIKSRVRMITQGYGGMGLGQAYEYTKSSQRVNIKVKPLPAEGRPSNFTGAVGTFDVNAAADSTTVPVGQPFSLRVRFQGNGNAKGIELPEIAWPKTVEIYDTKSESRFFKNGSSFKEFNVLVIPRAEGPLEIPAFSVSMFNPATGKYESRSTQPIPMQVTASAAVAGAGSQRLSDGPAAGAAAVAANENGIPSPELTYRPASLTGGLLNRPVTWAALYLAVFLSLIFKARMEFGGGRRRRDIRTILSKRYKHVDQLAAAGDWRRAGTEMTNLFSLVLGEAGGETGASEELAKILEKLPPSVRRDFGEALTKKHEIFQTIAFAPEAALGELKEPARLRREIEEAKTLLNRVIKKAVDHESESV